MPVGRPQHVYRLRDQHMAPALRLSGPGPPPHPAATATSAAAAALRPGRAAPSPAQAGGVRQECVDPASRPCFDPAAPSPACRLLRTTVFWLAGWLAGWLRGWLAGCTAGSQLPHAAADRVHGRGHACSRCRDRPGQARRVRPHLVSNTCQHATAACRTAAWVWECTQPAHRLCPLPPIHCSPSSVPRASHRLHRLLLAPFIACTRIACTASLAPLIACTVYCLHRYCLQSREPHRAVHGVRLVRQRVRPAPKARGDLRQRRHGGSSPSITH